MHRIVRTAAVAALGAALVLALTGCQSSHCNQGACCTSNKAECKDTSACCKEGKHCAACPANKGGQCCCAASK